MMQKYINSKDHTLRLGNISKDFTIYNMKKKTGSNVRLTNLGQFLLGIF